MNGESTAPKPPNTSQKRPHRLLRWLGWILLALGLFAVLFVIAVFAVRAWVLPDLTALQPRIEATLSKTLKQEVRIQGLGIEWDWASAQVVLNQISIGPVQTPALQASGVKATVLAHPLLWGSVQTSAEGLSVDSLTLSATQSGSAANPMWRVAGFDLSAPSDGAGLRWALAQPRIRVAALNIDVEDAAKHWLPEGRGMVALDNVALNALGLGGREHTVSARFAPAYNDPRLGKDVSLEATFNHGMLSDAAAFKRWSGQAIVNIPNAHVARTAVWALPFASAISASKATQWQRWAQQSVVDARLASHTVLQFDAGKLRASGKLAISGLPKEYSGSVAPLLWSWRPSDNLNVNAHAKDGGSSSNGSSNSNKAQPIHHAVQLGSDQLLLGPLNNLLRGAPLPKALQDAVDQAQANGTLSKVLLDAVVNGDGLHSLSVKANAQQLSMRSVDIAGGKEPFNIPSFDGLSGQLSVTHADLKTIGKFVLDSRNIRADLPRLFEQERIAFDELLGEVDVTLAPQRLAIVLRNLRFSNVDGKGELNGQYEMAMPGQTAIKHASSGLIAGAGVALLTGGLERVDLTQLHRYMPLSLSKSTRALLRDAIATGNAEQLQFNLKLKAGGVESLTAQAYAKGLGLRSVDIAGDKGPVNIPTIDGLSGQISVDHSALETVSKIVLDSRNISADLPRLFEQERIAFDALLGEIDVTVSPQRVALAMRNLRFSNLDGKGELNGQYALATPSNTGNVSNTPVPNPSLGIAKLTGTLERADLAKLHRYMPLSLSKNARAWLRHTIASGKAEQLQFSLNGELSRFPFLPEVAQAGERFDLVAQVRESTLNFNPLENTPPDSASKQIAPNKDIAAKPWPLLEKVAGELRLNGLSLTLLNMTGVSANIPLAMPKLTIASLTAPIVVFQTRATAPAQSVLDLIRATPLSVHLEEQISALKLTGNVSVDANLSLDIGQPNNNLHQANVTTDQVSLQLNPDIPPIERINAKLHIQQSKATVEQASAFWMGGIMQASGVLDTQNPAETLKVMGTAQLATVKQHFPNAMVQALLSHAQGGVDYGLDIAFKPEGIGWQIKADLKNTALQWPGLLDKAVGVSLPFTLTRSPTQRTVYSAAAPERRINQDVWEASLGASLLGPFKGIVERRFDGVDWRIDRGAVALGAAAELNTPEQGLGLHIATSKVNLDLLRSEVEALPWKALPAPPVLPASATLPKSQNKLLIAPQTPAAGRLDTAVIPTWMPSVVALEVADLTLANRRFYNVVGAAVRDTGDTVLGHQWSANLVAKGINGYFSWVDTSTTAGVGGGALVAKLTELNIPSGEVERTSKSLLRVAPEQVPSIDVTIERLSIANQSLGNVTLKASNLAKDNKQLGWNIDTLTAIMPHARLEATGQWIQPAQAADGDGQVAFKLALSSDNLGEALDAFGHGKLIAGAPGKLDADVRWKGTPFALDLPSLSGDVNAVFERGQFLKIDTGAGKLIGLFSLQNLPRRLTLDFRDTFEKGFAFNSINASAKITNGVLNTDDFLMIGSIATVRAAGTVSLVSETQALTFTVKPDFNAGSLSLLYMIINPPIGLATLAAQYLLKEPISRALTLEYSITGPWAKPDIKQVKREFK